MKKTQMIDCDVEILAQTERALLVSDGSNSFGVWIPKSQIETDDELEIGETVTIEVPEWLAMDRGLL